MKVAFKLHSGCIHGPCYAGIEPKASRKPEFEAPTSGVSVALVRRANNGFDPAGMGCRGPAPWAGLVETTFRLETGAVTCDTRASIEL